MARIDNPKTPRVNTKRVRPKDNPDGWEFITVVAVCRTEGCPAKDIGFDTTVGENYDSIYRVECAQCHQEPEMHQPGTSPVPVNNNWRKPVGGRRHRE